MKGDFKIKLVVYCKCCLFCNFTSLGTKGVFFLPCLHLQICCELVGVVSCSLDVFCLFNPYCSSYIKSYIFTCRQFLIGEKYEGITLPVLVFCVVSDLRGSSQFLQLKPSVILSRSSRSVTACVSDHPGTCHLGGSTVFYCSGWALCPRRVYCMFCKVVFILFCCPFSNFWFQAANVLLFAECSLRIFRGMLQSQGQMCKQLFYNCVYVTATKCHSLANVQALSRTCSKAHQYTSFLMSLFKAVCQLWFAAGELKIETRQNPINNRKHRRVFNWSRWACAVCMTSP